MSSTSSLNSVEAEHSPPQILQDEQSAPHDARKHSIGSLSLSGLRRSVSGGLFRTAGSISRYPTQMLEGYSVREIYGNLDEDMIDLRRTNTRNTILDTLQHRVTRSMPQDIESHPDAAGLTHESLYEKMPDTSVPVKDGGEEFATIDPELVTWDGPDDPENPRNWSRKEKLLQTAIVSVYSLLSPMSSSMLSPAMTDIAESLHIENDTVKSLCVSIMVLAWALGPLVLAPLSESDRVGRKPVLNWSIWIVALFNLCCGFVKTPAQLCVLRFLGGLGGCAPLNVGAGTLADLWSDSQRLLAMSFYSLGPTLGPVLAPVISSFIVTGKDWHWCFYVLAIFNFFVAAVGTLLFKETYPPRLLKKKAILLRKETGNEHLHTIYEIADGETAMGKLIVTVSRPISLIIGHPMVFGLGLFMAFTYGFMYLFIVTFPEVYKGTYNMSTNIAGLMYLSLGIGFLLGTFTFQIAIDKTYRHLTKKNGGVPKPEFRLPCLILSGIFIPAGLILYGWAAEKKLPWIALSFGAGIFAFVLVAVFQSIQNYLIDMNNRFAASSVAAAAVFRSLFGFAFPLVATPMYNKLNYGWGNTLCAFIALALGIPFPLFCIFYGERLRNWANARFDRKQAIRDARNLERLKVKNEKKLELDKQVIERDFAEKQRLDSEKSDKSEGSGI